MKNSKMFILFLILSLLCFFDNVECCKNLLLMIKNVFSREASYLPHSDSDDRVPLDFFDEEQDDDDEQMAPLLSEKGEESIVCYSAPSRQPQVFRDCDLEESEIIIRAVKKRRVLNRMFSTLFHSGIQQGDNAQDSCVVEKKKKQEDMEFSDRNPILREIFYNLDQDKSPKEYLFLYLNLPKYEICVLHALRRLVPMRDYYRQTRLDVMMGYTQACRDELDKIDEEKTIDFIDDSREIQLLYDKALIAYFKKKEEYKKRLAKLDELIELLEDYVAVCSLT